MFFVNGSNTSSASIRAQQFAQKLPTTWKIYFNYRPSPKWKGISTFIQAALRHRPDVIYVMDTAYTGVIAGCLAKSWLDCKLITDTGDVAYELAKSVGTYSRKQLALIQWVEQMAMLRSDAIVVRGSYHKTWLEKQGIFKAVFIPDGVDKAEIEPIDRAESKRNLGLDQYLVVGMIGNMAWSERHQICYGWDIVEALGLLQDLPVKALLVGDGDGRSILEQRVEALGIRDRLIFTGRVPYEELSQYLAAMDVCVSTQSNDLVGMVRTTGKLPLYLAHGKYVIATDVGEASRVLPSVGCLLPYEGVRDDQHPARLADHLRLLRKEPHRLQVSEAAQQVARDNFDYQLLAHRLEKLCLELVHS
jgi:glycosyltransferase involved in cell wall biosynthesis